MAFRHEAGGEGTEAEAAGAATEAETVERTAAATATRAPRLGATAAMMATVKARVGSGDSWVGSEATAAEEETKGAGSTPERSSISQMAHTPGAEA